MGKVLKVRLSCGARVELIPVFGEFGLFAGYRLNVIHVPGEGLASPDELDEIAAMLTEAAGGARGAAG